MDYGFTSLETLVTFARLRSLRGLYDGRQTLKTQALIELCRHRFTLSPEHGAVIIFTRDVHHHTSGWWKNPDYERCWHLSISYRQHHEGPIPVDVSLPQEKATSERIARAFFGNDVRWLWCEPPYSAEGKFRDVWHYRLFANPAWEPLLPRGEVYDKRNTPAEWKSFSELHGYRPEPEDAPFFARSSE